MDYSFCQYLIMQKIYKTFKSLIQQSKKLYFMHFVVVAMFPATLLCFIALLCIPHDLYVFLKHGILGDEDLFMSFIGMACIYYLYSLLFLIIVCILLAIITSIIKYLLKNPIYVTSNFLLYNKLYNFLYVSSFIFLFFYFLICIESLIFP